jgi:hypothetical protein
MPEENDLSADQGDQGVNGDGNEPIVAPKEGDGQPDNGDGAGGQEPKGDGNPDEKDQGDMEPPVKARKTAKDFIIQRKEAKIAKLQAKLDEKKGDGDDDQGDQDGDNENEGGILPADRKAILETIAPVLQPFIDKSLQAEDETEVAEFVKANPEFSPFAAKARKFMSHPSRRNIPIETIFMEAAGGVNGVMKLGAQRLKNITDKAKNGASGGGPGGAGDGKKAWGDMNPGEFETEKRRMLEANRQ